jgi:hypothetical protein
MAIAKGGVRLMKNENTGSLDKAAVETAAVAQEAWEKPEIASFAPVRSAQGISYLPGDGVSNLTP